MGRWAVDRGPAIDSRVYRAVSEYALRLLARADITECAKVSWTADKLRRKVLPSCSILDPDGLLILADRVFLHNRERLMDFATKQKLPSVNAYRELVQAGGLMSYGPSYEDMHRRAAGYVDKILKGAKPADLPV